jgi:hypothetical protein
MVMNRLRPLIGRMADFVGTAGDLSADIPTTGSVVNSLEPSVDRDLLEVFDQDEGARNEAYERWMSYYTNDQYTVDALDARESEATRTKGNERSAQLEQLYKFVRSFYNPIAQAVDMDVASIFGSETVIQMDDESSDLAEVLDEIVADSHLDTELATYVRLGAINGDVYLRTVDDWENERAFVQVLAPNRARVVRNPHNRMEPAFGVISYEYVDYDVTPTEVHVRTDVIRPDVVRTYRDRELYGFDGYAAESDNPLREVTVEHVMNFDTGALFGLPTFHNVLPILDAVNEVVSFVVNVVKMNADPPVLAYGIQEGELVQGSSTNPLASTVFYIPTDPERTVEMKLLEWSGNFGEIRGLLQDIRSDVIDMLPEMHVTKMQQQGAYSGQALNAMMFAFVRKIGMMRPLFVEPLRRSLSRALAIRDIMAGNTTTYDPRDPRYKVKLTLPPVLPVDEDALLNRVLAKLTAGIIAPQQALRELSYPDDRIAAILAEADAYAKKLQQRAIQTAQATRPPTSFGGVGSGANTNAQKGANQASKNTNGQPVNKQLRSGQ